MKESVPGPRFEDVFRQMTDFQLGSCLSSAVEKKYGYESVVRWSEHIPISHRVVKFVWSTTGYGECEGYVAFMWLDCKHAAFSAAFREIGLHDLGSLIDAMLAPVIDRNVLGNLDALEQFFGGWEPFAEWVARFESDLFAASDRIEAAVARYCRANEESFRVLWPEIQGTRTFQKVLLGNGAESASA